MVFASLVGSLYALISVYFCVDGVLGVLLNIAFSIIMCRICSGKCTIKTLFKLVSCFYILSVFLGGVLSALSNIMQSFSEYIRKPVPLHLLLFVSAFLCFAFMTVGKKISSGLSMTKVLIELNVFGKTGRINLMCDSGNVAVDPYSGKYVIVVKKMSLEQIVGDKINDIENGFTNATVISSVKPRLIPIKTVAGECIMTAFIPEKLFVISDKDRVEIDACIAIDSSEESGYLGADGVVPFALISDLL